MKLLENLNDGWWKNHQAHKAHYIGWFIIFKQMAKENERKGFLDLAKQCEENAKNAKRNLQRVLVGNI